MFFRGSFLENAQSHFSPTASPSYLLLAYCREVESLQALYGIFLLAPLQFQGIVRMEPMIFLYLMRAFPYFKHTKIEPKSNLRVLRLMLRILVKKQSRKADEIVRNTAFEMFKDWFHGPRAEELHGNMDFFDDGFLAGNEIDNVIGRKFAAQTQFLKMRNNGSFGERSYGGNFFDGFSGFRERECFGIGALP